MIQVNQETCIRCGTCVVVCPSEILNMTPQGPEEINRGCIACGHCVAVCPTAALDINKAPLSSQVPICEELKINEAQAIQFLRSRRSIRGYKKDELVSKEKLEKILDIARLAPTGSNGQGTQFAVIEDPKVVDQIRNKMADHFEKAFNNGHTIAKGYQKILDAYRSGKDTFLRGAPQMILALNEEANRARHGNGQFALTYAELYAPTIGVGTCWAGFFMWYVESNPEEVKNLLQLPEGMKVTAALMVGVPKYTYYRLPERDPLKALWR